MTQADSVNTLGTSPDQRGAGPGDPELARLREQNGEWMISPTSLSDYRYKLVRSTTTKFARDAAEAQRIIDRCR